MKPSISRDVHYVSYGTPGGEFASACRAAKVTEVNPDNPNHVGLMVMNPTGLFFHSLKDGGCHYDNGSETPGEPDCPNKQWHGDPHPYCSCGWIEAHLVGGTWHWPERVEV
jgi:hypothetical protein